MVGYIIFILVGVIAVVFRNKLAQGYVKFQNSNFGFHFGERTIRFNVMLNIIGGILFIAVGILGVFGVLPPLEGI